MKKYMRSCAFCLFLLTPSLVLAETVAEQVKSSVASGTYETLQTLAAASPTATDDVVRTLLALTQENLIQKPATSSKAVSYAAKLAEHITPPSVPAICADMRRIVSSMPAESAGTPLAASVVSASKTFAQAPVVVAAGRPKLCEEAWLEANNIDGDVDAQLAQQPGIVPTPMPPFIIKPSGE